MKMWITNYINWVMDYSVGKIDAMETNVITKAKRYLADHYDDAELTLAKVAEHVGLSENISPTALPKRPGRPFPTILPSCGSRKPENCSGLLRLKAMRSENGGLPECGALYEDVQKETGCTPAQYRKQGEQ